MKTLILSLSLLLTLPLWAQIEPEEEYLRSHATWETLTEKIPVSGGTFVGFMFERDPTTKIDVKVFYVFIPEDAKADKLFVEFSSKDGRYNGKLRYKLDEAKGGSIEAFKLPTRYYKELEKYDAEEIVILAAVTKPGSDNKREYYLPASWEEVSNTNAAVMYINTSLSSKIMGAGLCKTLSQPTVAYNQVCHFTLDPKTQVLKLQQRMEEYGSVSMVEKKIKYKWKEGEK